MGGTEGSTRMRSSSGRMRSRYESVAGAWELVTSSVSDASAATEGSIRER